MSVNTTYGMSINLVTEHKNAALITWIIDEKFIGHHNKNIIAVHNNTAAKFFLYLYVLTNFSKSSFNVQADAHLEGGCSENSTSAVISLQGLFSTWPVAELL